MVYIYIILYILIGVFVMIQGTRMKGAPDSRVALAGTVLWPIIFLLVISEWMASFYEKFER